MAAKNKPYERFASYILFKKLDGDSFGDLWRAGAIEGDHLGPIVAIRRFTGGDRAAMTQAATVAKTIAPLLGGTSFARHQIIDFASDGTPFIAYDYSGGRSLRHIVDRARGGTGSTPNPVPIDQAIAIAEKIALSLDTTANLKYQGTKLTHGGLIPQLVWISDDGEIRVAGQQLGKGLVASLKNPAIASEIGNYFAPEYRTSGEANKASEVYSLGAILYLLVTGLEPPDPNTASAFQLAVRGSKLMAGGNIPEDIRELLEKSLAVDPAARYATVGDMKQALSSLVHGGRYSATTFNLAFYLSNLLKKEMEGEAIDRDRESKVAVGPYLESAPVSAVAAASLPSPAPFTLGAPQQKSKAPMFAGIAAAAALIAAGAYFGLRKGGNTPVTPTATTSASTLATSTGPSKAQQQIAAEPIVAAAPANALTGTTTSTGPADDAARKKAFEQEVKKRLQEEMMKLQTDFNSRQGSGSTPSAPAVAQSAPSRPAPAPADDRSGSAAQLDQQRRAETPARPDTAPAPQQQAPAPAVAQSQPAPAPAAPQVAAVREGDLVPINEVDTVPQTTRPIRPTYPPLAIRQHAEGNVILSALISENGDVLDVKILRGDPRFGFEEAASRAVRGAHFSPAVKDGKRVRTWKPIPVVFSLKQ
jgi:TonB family protein